MMPKQAEPKPGHGTPASQSELLLEAGGSSLVAQVKDPVCGMNVDPKAAKGGQTTYEGKLYYFCNPKCKSKFESNPLAYIGARAPLLLPPDDGLQRYYLAPCTLKSPSSDQALAPSAGWL